MLEKVTKPNHDFQLYIQTPSYLFAYCLLYFPLLSSFGNEEIRTKRDFFDGQTDKSGLLSCRLMKWGGGEAILEHGYFQYNYLNQCFSISAMLRCGNFISQNSPATRWINPESIRCSNCANSCTNGNDFVDTSWLRMEVVRHSEMTWQIECFRGMKGYGMKEIRHLSTGAARFERLESSHAQA